MAKFNVTTLNMATTTTKKGGIGMITAAGYQAEIIEVIGNGSGTSAPADVQHNNLLEFSTGAPADVQHSCVVEFSTGTVLAAGSAVTPAKFSQNSNVSKFTSTEIDTILTTEGEALQTPAPVSFGFNQRGGMRWAVPRGEGVILAFDHANEDLVMSQDSNANGNVDASIHWWEA